MRYQDATVMAAFRGMAKYLAQTLGPLPFGATKFEVWNEPNISRSLYPQRKGKKLPGLRTFASIARCSIAFSEGDQERRFCSYTVIAGATAPALQQQYGGDLADRVGQQSQEAQHVAATSTRTRITRTRSSARAISLPTSCLLDPAHMINLANLNVLLKIYPTKPFYLTEFGYATRYSLAFGVVVSQAKQAAFLSQGLCDGAQSQTGQGHALVPDARLGARYLYTRRRRACTRAS